MNQRIKKLERFFDGGGAETAIEALVEAGYSTPKLIKAATDEQLLAVSGIGPAKLAAIRERCPHFE